MLRSLRVRDLATVADVTLELGPGLNVLTGETGAGKSMVVDALALALGDRADRAAVRTGASRAVVDAVWDVGGDSLAARLDAAGLDQAEALVVRREVSVEGRSRAWVNGSPTTIGVLADLGGLLADMHGQHQSLELTQAATQRDLLDAYAGAAADRAAVTTAFQAVTDLRADVAALVTQRDTAIRRADWLRHVVTEIDAARIRPGEDVDLAREAARLGSAGVLGEQAREALDRLDAESDGLRPGLAHLSRILTHLARRDPEVADWPGLLEPAWAVLDDLARRIEAYRDEISDDPERLGVVEGRRDRLQGLMQKHGGSLDAVLDTRRAAADELDLIDRSVLDLDLLERRRGEAERAFATAAAALSTRRTAAAQRLGGEVTRILPSLGMPDAVVEVHTMPRDVAGPDGVETIGIVAQLNPGLAARPIATAASGGELSRLMLALKVALLRHDEAPTLVFDEIDQGVGGETGGHIAAALAQLATRHQVLVITHLPQIAARADRHLVVQKGNRGGIATSDVTTVHGDDRVVELARMLGSADDAHARRLALSLLGRGVSG